MSKHQITSDRTTIVNTLTKLSPGAMVDIQFSSNKQQRIKAKLVGYQEGAYFAFSLPQHIYAQQQDHLFEGKSCVIRMIVEGDAGLCVAFKTKLITINKKPQIMLFVEYPEQIEFIQLRHKNRINTHLPVVITEQQAASISAEEASSNMLEGVVLDLSEGGCRIELAAPSQTLSMVFVQIVLRFPLNPEQPIVLNGTIKSQQQTSDKLRLGVQLEANKQLKAVFSKLNMFNHPSLAA